MSPKLQKKLDYNTLLREAGKIRNTFPKHVHRNELSCLFVF